MSTASGLVFAGEEDGNVMAFDAASGKNLWRLQTGAGLRAGPMSFMHNGKQYVVVASGRSGDCVGAARRTLIPGAVNRLMPLDRPSSGLGHRGRFARGVEPPENSSRPSGSVTVFAFATGWPDLAR